VRHFIGGVVYLCYSNVFLKVFQFSNAPQGRLENNSAVGKANYQTIFPNPLRGYSKKSIDQ
jgi:hypothetical protein